MKKNYTVVFAAVTALIALCAFWGCSSSDDDDGPSLPNAEESGLGNETSISGERVYNNNGTSYSPGSTMKTVWADDSGSVYKAVVAANSRIETNGTLTLKLSDFISAGDWSQVDANQFQTDGLQVTPSDVRTVLVGVHGIRTDDFKLAKTNGTHTAEFVYADKDATVQGVNVDLILQQGWNWIIADISSGTVITGIPDSTYRWVIIQ
ncbi:MAG: hypothetical protein LBK13_07485 [Spirochaetales bacterium]|jgi:hypothetical protein|nr:hypothetical protein [Spirochaetales bacterium]